MRYEIVAYETPYIVEPKRTTVIGTLGDARSVAECLSQSNYEVYVTDSNGLSVACLIDGKDGEW